MKYLALIATVLSISYASLPYAYAGPSEIRLDTVLASASTWSNMRKSSGSVRAESENLLQMAERKLREIKATTGACARGTIFFDSTPNLRLSGPTQTDECGGLSQKTEREPLTYSGLSFDSIEAFAAWFGDFSQGKGKEGKDLYVRCPGNCSPGYATEVELNQGQYVVVARVQCGLPRDKDDNQFKLSARVLCR